uniref:Uncharacterized protein n=1 Tax=Parascaris equorum TaxID=6256 RepID=A0A914RFJ0_PAREQ
MKSSVNSAAMVRQAAGSSLMVRNSGSTHARASLNISRQLTSAPKINIRVMSVMHLGRIAISMKRIVVDIVSTALPFIAFDIEGFRYRCAVIRCLMTTHFKLEVGEVDSRQLVCKLISNNSY